MHLTSYENATRFVEAYPLSQGSTVAELGSQIIEGQESLRQLFSDDVKYLGYDFASGKGVDVVLTDPYLIPAKDNTFDRVLTSSCFEHAEFFWLSFLEIARVCKQGGLIYLNAPSNGVFHRYPSDCWRFYPDSGLALERWAKREGIDLTLLESYTSHQKLDCWNDYVAVFYKHCPENDAIPQDRILSNFQEVKNGYLVGSPELINYTEVPEDMVRRKISAGSANGEIDISW
jgi:SAM-dependent methyltransferase